MALPWTPSRLLNGPPDRGRALGPAVVFALAVLAFAPTLENDFVYDDVLHVTQNPLITSLGKIPTLLTTGYFAGYSLTLDPTNRPRGGVLYRPLVTISFALNYAMGGLRPIGYHVVNILLHAGVSLAVYALGCRLLLTRGGATVAAALFAVHPLHTEAVAGIVGRADLLMALGVLLALHGYLRGGRAGRLGSLAAFALGLLSKEQAVMLPPLLVLADLHARMQSSRSPRWAALVRGSLIRLSPYVGILGVYLSLRIWVVGKLVLRAGVLAASFLDNPLVHAPSETRVLTALAVGGRYLMLCLWPFPLSPDYSYNQIPLATSLFDGRVLLAALLWGSLIALGVRSGMRGSSAAGFFVLFTLVTFFPVSNLLFPITTIMGERLFYLPSVGLSWLAGLGWQIARAWTDRPPIWHTAWGILAVLLLIFTVQTVSYGQIWRDDLTLFSHAVQVAPQSARTHYLLGLHATTPEASLREFEEAVRIYPEFPARHADFNVNLGARLLQAERIEDAITALDRAVTLAPRMKGAHYNLGLAYAKQGRWMEAEARYRQALALDRGQASYHNSLSFVLRRQARNQDALAEAEEAIRLNPTFAEAHYNRARALEALGRVWEAVAASERALALEPNLPVARQLLDGLRTRVGK